MAGVKVGINGFGRIGRLVFRALVEQKLLGSELDVVAVNDLVGGDNIAYLLKYDSTQGRFDGEVTSRKSSASATADDTLVVNGHGLKCLAIKDGPAAMPWKELGVEYVIESTGLFTECSKKVCKTDEKPKEGEVHPNKTSYGHILAGAKKVIISAPAKN